MLPAWIIEVAARQKAARITGRDIAMKAGISRTYLSLILSGKRNSEPARHKILAALDELEKEKTDEPVTPDSLDPEN